MNNITDTVSDELQIPQKNGLSTEFAKRNERGNIDMATGQRKRNFFREQAHRFKKHRSIIWFVLPAFCLALLFGYVPMIGMLIAFRDKFIIAGGRTVFEAFENGSWSLENFRLLITDDRIGLALKNTLIINAFSILIVFPLPILFALLFADIKNSAVSKLILIVLCLPNFLSWTMTVGIWANVLSPTDGMFNNFLVALGVLKEPYYFFGSNSWFKTLVIFLKIWKGTGWGSIIYYAAIASIDKSFYEAATLDGATKIQKIIYITLPTIVPVIGLSLIMTLTYIMNVGLEQVFAMYTSGTRYEQYVVDTFLYDISLQDRSNAPLATILGIINGLIALVLMLGGNAVSKKLLKTSLW